MCFNEKLDKSDSNWIVISLKGIWNILAKALPFRVRFFWENPNPDFRIQKQIFVS